MTCPWNSNCDVVAEGKLEAGGRRRPSGIAALEDEIGEMRGSLPQKGSVHPRVHLFLPSFSVVKDQAYLSGERRLKIGRQSQLVSGRSGIGMAWAVLTKAEPFRPPVQASPVAACAKESSQDWLSMRKRAQRIHHGRSNPLQSRPNTFAQAKPATLTIRLRQGGGPYICYGPLRATDAFFCSLQCSPACPILARVAEYFD